MSDTYEQVTGVPRTFLVLIGLMTAALVLGLLLTDRASDRSVVGPDPTTPEPQATGESGEPELLSLSVRGAVTCSGSFVAATVTWTTVNTDEVAVHVDGRISEAAMSPRGHTEIGVPCDGSDHSILVVASGADGNATLSHEIVTAPLRDPDPPKVISFSVASPAQCNGTQALVAATWSATSARSVTFEIDGTASTDPPRSPDSNGQITVPCSGTGNHVVRLVVEGLSRHLAQQTAHVRTT